MSGVEERCCGCSIRTGCLTLLWTALVAESLNLYSYWFTYSLILESSQKEKQNSYYDDPATTNVTIKLLRCLCYAIISSIAIIVYAFGIYGIYKNVPNYLNGSFYFFCYYAIHLSIAVILLPYAPSWYEELYTHFRYIRDRSVHMDVLMYFVAILLMIHFTQVIRNCRDYMITKNKNASHAEVDNNSRVTRY